MNEATIIASLQIRTGNIDYRSNPSSFQANVVGQYGPTPGAVLVGVLDTTINLSALSTPGLGIIHNLDLVNYIDYGILDTVANVFHPIHRILPGEIFPVRFSPEMFQGLVGTSTSETGADVLCMRANVAPCWVSVEVFEA